MTKQDLLLFIPLLVLLYWSCKRIARKYCSTDWEKKGKDYYDLNKIRG